MALQLTAVAVDPALLLVPWDRPLEQWTDEHTVALPRGISRHVVRFVRVSDVVYAVKEIPERIATKEFRLLGEMERSGIPAVDPVGVVTGRVAADGEELTAALITRHLPFSLPYRVLFSARPTEGTADRLISALVVLLARLHLAGFMWGDCSLSNTLFRRDAGLLEAYLVDAETSEHHETVSAGQRAWDLELATMNCTGELLDLQAGGLLPNGDPIELGSQIQQRYEQLWAALTEPLAVGEHEVWRIQERVRQIQDLGFDVAEVSMARKDAEGERLVVMQPLVVASGHHYRRLLGLTGLSAGENQARRLLADFDQFRAEQVASVTEQEAAGLWLTQRYQPLLAAVPDELRARLELPEIFHEALEHRWYLSQADGRDVPWEEAVARYVAEILAQKPEEIMGTAAGSEAAGGGSAAAVQPGATNGAVGVG